MQATESVLVLCFNSSLLKYGGDLAIGAMTAVTSIVLLFLMPVFGMSQGMQTIIAYNYGAKQYNRARKTLLISIAVSTLILSVGLLVIKLWPKQLVSIFTNDSDLLKLAVNGMSVYSITLPILGICILGTMYFQSIGSAKKSMLLSLLRQVIILIPVIFVAPKIYGLKGVWISQPIADIISTLIVAVFLFIELRKSNLRSIFYDKI